MSTPAGLQVNLLGPVTAVLDGVELPITAPRRRAVLARLALEPGRAVSAEKLLDDVWGDDVPATGVRAVAHQISMLRTSLEPAADGEGSVIETTSAGYALRVDPECVDIHRFQRLVDESRDLLVTDAEGASGRVEEALALVRGRPLADLGDEPFAEREIRRLDQRLLLAERTRLESLLAVGRHVEVVGDLGTLLERHPLEEGLVGLLMTALDRSGRTADALQAYRDLQRRLGAELGIEPSPSLQNLEADLLTRKSAIDPVPREAPENGTSPGRARLPVPVSSLIGRDDELAEILGMLDAARLVTVCGLGGMGKTRLAQEVAATERQRSDGDVWFVDLISVAPSSTSTSDSVADAVATAGNVSVASGRDPIDHLVDAIADRRLLLVIDNCEHLVDEVALVVGAVITAAPDVRVLATSRVRLGIPGEAVWSIPPLTEPSALQLFTDRANLARPGFASADDAETAVGELCRRLDGIPLAIEMAAARLSVMSISQIADNLDDRFRLLTASDGTPAGNQPSLEAVMAWSHELLAPSDRRLLERMSVCSGGFTLDATIAIGAPSEASVIDVLDALDHLVEASLVVFDGDRSDPRYRILEPVRHYVGGLLSKEQRDDAGLAHARYFETVAERIGELYDSGDSAGHRLAEAELGNLRAAMAWAHAKDHPLLGIAVILGCRQYFWSLIMHRETLRWSSLFVDLVDEDTPSVLHCVCLAATEAFNSGDDATAGRMAARLGRALPTVEDPALRARMLSAMATARIEFDPVESGRLYQEGLEAIPDPAHAALGIMNNLVEVSWFSGRLDRADHLLARLDGIRATGHGTDSMMRKIEAGVAARQARWDDVLALTDDLTATPAARAALGTLRAEALGALGRPAEGLEAIRRLGLEVEQSHHLRNAKLVRAGLHIQLGDPRTAVELLVDMLDQRGEGERPGVAWYLVSLIGAATSRLGLHHTAAMWLGHGTLVRDRLGAAMRPSDGPLVDEAVASCREALGNASFEKLSAEGATLDVDALPRPNGTQMA